MRYNKGRAIAKYDAASGHWRADSSSRPRSLNRPLTRHHNPEYAHVTAIEFPIASLPLRRNAMSDPRRTATTTRIALMTAVICGFLLATPHRARASAADCSAAMSAATLQSKTPFHATITVTPTTPGAFPIEHHEEIWVGNKMYTLLGDKRWLSDPRV